MTKRSKGERTKERILDVAQDLILRNGFSATSIDEIIADAELTKGGFFYHFEGGKSELARALVERYLEQDDVFFDGLIERARALVEDPLQQLLLFLNLFAEAMDDLPGAHPGCLVASFTYESQQLDPSLRRRMADGLRRWRATFLDLIQRAADAHPLDHHASPPALEEVADMLTATVEGGIILSRALDDPKLLGQQLHRYRDYVRLLFAG